MELLETRPVGGRAKPVETRVSDFAFTGRWSPVAGGVL